MRAGTPYWSFSSDYGAQDNPAKTIFIKCQYIGYIINHIQRVKFDYLIKINRKKIGKYNKYTYFCSVCI